MHNILQEIVEHKRTEITAAKTARPLHDLEAEIARAQPARDFCGALRANHPMGLIAEVKRASPSAGLIREDFDPVEIAREYVTHGAACLSVLTDEKFFKGSLDDLRSVRAAVDAPLLRKDFILDRHQIYEARAAGADCVLLIAECLSDDELGDLHNCAGELGMQTLIEFYEPENLSRVLALSPRLVGVNNRNLRTFVTDLDHSIRLRANVPDDILMVSESGIRDRGDVVRLQEAGIHAILVGETLMRHAEIGPGVEALLGKGTGD
ncbi:MAG: indole-3-glycerol phosphate synthase TrpC [Planctomycetota bacterium]|nr:MAG: indole-3-glycerol phosphate synthase TrpC [Planctomycetota bacterium]REK30698.1 MAG: indole-3-glycerol phosphate synthase TrpC [Planctomycetota bacterium]REK33073.1 MAG: indole-3-glycerol phosphate synthase TrpC [Planctomycetota bacterium]